MSDDGASGWYEDPDDPDMLRWWDGTRWEDHRRPWTDAERARRHDEAPVDEEPVDDVPADDPRADDPRPTDDGRRSVYRRRRLAVAAAAIVVLAAVAATISLVASGDGSSTRRRGPSERRDTSSVTGPRRAIETVRPGPTTPTWTQVELPAVPTGTEFGTATDGVRMVVGPAWTPTPTPAEGRVAAWVVTDDASGELGTVTVEVLTSPRRVDAVAVANALAAEPDADHPGAAVSDTTMLRSPDGARIVARVDYATGDDASAVAARAWSSVESTPGGGSIQTIVRLVSTPQHFAAAAEIVDAHAASARPWTE